MKRAVILIVVMSLLGAGVGFWMEKSLQKTCGWYLEQEAALRQLVESGALADALQEQRYVHARWQEESQRLNALVSHHHTRSVDEALLALSTALEHGWQKDALRALDLLYDSLADLVMDMSLRWENVL